jgi:hypothetical protein
VARIFVRMMGLLTASPRSVAIDDVGCESIAALTGWRYISALLNRARRMDAPSATSPPNDEKDLGS